jgi:hypothetical protein
MIRTLIRTYKKTENHSTGEDNQQFCTQSVSIMALWSTPLTEKSIKSIPLGYRVAGA